MMEGQGPPPPLVKEKNFPPLPSFCCVGPCFYHDITVEIPMESQRTCRIMFHLWQFYVFTLFFNCITTLAALCIGYEGGGEMFGLSLVFLVLFTPLSFLFWYRSIYKALKSDSSFSYMMFFFLFTAQIIVVFIFCLGISATAGWINALAIANSNKEGKTGVSVMFFISAALFTLLCLLQVLVLRKIHRHYRSSGASFEGAKNEFAQEGARAAADVVVPRNDPNIGQA